MSGEQPERAPKSAPTATRHALIRLIAVVAAGIGLAVATNSVPVLVVILALIVMVMVHELGHFVAAKASGMKVTEYFLGFGPRLWSIRRGETEYGVKAIPAGGYVRIVGMTTAEEVEPTDEPRSYRQSTFPRRFAVGMAGSTMHFVMAYLLLFSLLAIVGLPTAATAEVTALRNFANATAPASSAGVKPGDVLVAIDGVRYSRADEFVSAIQGDAGRATTLTVSRHGKLVTLHLTPLDGRHLEVKTASGTEPVAPPSGPPVGVIGVELQYVNTNVRTNPFAAVPRAGAMLGSLTKATALGIGQVFSPHGLGSFVHQVANANKPTPQGAAGNSGGQIVSIVGAVQIGAQAARQNIADLLLILVAINLFVGMVNLFPMLPLDGGHVAIAIYERLRSRRQRAYHADVTKLMPFAYLFLAGIVLLGLGALYLNVLHPATLPGG